MASWVVSTNAGTIDLGWSAPATRVDAATARQSILSQHERLRALLARAVAVAEAALDGHPPSDDAVASAIADVRTTIEVHLAFEEKARWTSIVVRTSAIADATASSDGGCPSSAASATATARARRARSRSCCDRMLCRAVAASTRVAGADQPRSIVPAFVLTTQDAMGRN